MPRIKTTRTVALALWALRIYLLILLSLIGLKFVRVFSAPRAADAPAPAAVTEATNRPATPLRP
jgi:hypothetical protein